MIQKYLDDQPYPSALILSWRGDRPIHVVAAVDDIDKKTIIITVYEPDAIQWDMDFKKRKKV